jgi:Mg-chelatase subunit ChlD
MEFQAYSLQHHPEWACLHVSVNESQTRTPVHLCCVIDTSASMDSDSKLENVKQSLHFLLDFLGSQDTISIITFSETAKTILSNITATTSEKDNIRARISIIRSESNTNLSAAIVQSRESLVTDTTHVKQGILLLTDGIANLGLTRPSDILELVRNTINQFGGTSISCVGYGTDHNSELLQNISTDGGGSYYVVNNLEDVATVFGDILGGLVSCTCQQVRVILPKNTEVKTRYSVLKNDDNVEVVIGDMSSGMDAAFLAKLPLGKSVTLKGYNLETHSSFSIIKLISYTVDLTLQVNGEAHYLRFEVLSLLEQARSLLLQPYSRTKIQELLIKINQFIDSINLHRSQNSHTLWDILLQELNNCKTSLETTRNSETPHLMTQHVGYLGRMRGIAAPMSPSQGDVYSDIPLERTFSNIAQRRISSQLVATVTPMARRRCPVEHDPVNIPEEMDLYDDDFSALHNPGR